METSSSLGVKLDKVQVSNSQQISSRRKARGAHNPQNQAEDIPNANSSEVIHKLSKVRSIYYSCSIQGLTINEQGPSATENSPVIGMAVTKMAPLPRTSIRELQTIAQVIKSSTSDLLSPIRDQLTQLDLKTFADSILASTSKIETLNVELVTTGAVGQFIFFPKLPVEIRLEIWRLALPSPRIIEVFQTLEKLYERKSEIKVNNPPLTLLHVNREAREVASNKYMLLSNVSASSLDFYHARLDPNKDTIFIPWSWFWFSFPAGRGGGGGG
jgi:hypothetical protein